MSWGKIGARRMVSTLPYDAEVEWLESTGTQWIDTGLNADSNLGYVLSAANLSGTTAVFYDGAIVTSPLIVRHHIGINNNNLLAVYLRNDIAASITSSASDSAFHEFEYDAVAKTARVDSVVSSVAGLVPFNVGIHFYLLARNNAGTANTSKNRLAFARFYQSGVLVKNLISVRIGTTGALYDRRGVGGMNPDGSARTDGLYFNRGSGAFGIGPDKIA